MNSSDQDSTRRFSSRVADYVKYRPGYPAEIVAALRQAGVLPTGSVIADIGSGTGLLAQIFLHAGFQVIGVEPNPDMRQAGNHELRNFPNFKSVNGTAEATTLPDAGIDLVTAAQAFHWFDRQKTKHEFRRILRGDRWVALIWNERLAGTTPFLQAYEDLLKEFSTDYAAVDHRQMTPELIAAFFAPNSVTTLHFPNRQIFDFNGARGRLLSSSYAPPPGHSTHIPMLQKLKQIFDTHEQNNQVTFEYDAILYTGSLK